MAGILGLPAGIVLVGYLCMGYVARFTDAPNARASRWRKPAVVGIRPVLRPLGEPGSRESP